MKILLIIVIILLATIISIAIFAMWKIRRAKNRIIEKGAEILIDTGMAASKIVVRKFKEKK